MRVMWLISIPYFTRSYMSAILFSLLPSFAPRFPHISSLPSIASISSSINTNSLLSQFYFRPCSVGISSYPFINLITASRSSRIRLATTAASNAIPITPPIPILKHVSFLAFGALGQKHRQAKARIPVIPLITHLTLLLLQIFTGVVRLHRRYVPNMRHVPAYPVDEDAG